MIDWVMAKTERNFSETTGVPMYKLEDFRKDYMLEGMDWVRGGKGGRQIIYTLDGEAKAQAWYDEMREADSFGIEDEGTGVVLRIVNGRNMYVSLWNGEKAAVVVPPGFKVSIGWRLPVRHMEGTKKWTLDTKRIQEDIRFVRVLKQLKFMRR